jgi:hypothetical protein
MLVGERKVNFISILSFKTMNTLFTLPKEIVDIIFDDVDATIYNMCWVSTAARSLTLSYVRKTPNSCDPQTIAQMGACANNLYLVKVALGWGAVANRFLAYTSVCFASLRVVKYLWKLDSKLFYPVELGSRLRPKYDLDCIQENNIYWAAAESGSIVMVDWVCDHVRLFCNTAQSINSKLMIDHCLARGYFHILEHLHNMEDIRVLVGEGHFWQNRELCNWYFLELPNSQNHYYDFHSAAINGYGDILKKIIGTWESKESDIHYPGLNRELQRAKHRGDEKIINIIADYLKSHNLES